jgi:hypothetical protein
MRGQSVIVGVDSGGRGLSNNTAPYGPYVGPCDIGFLAKVDATTGSVAVDFEIFLIQE